MMLSNLVTRGHDTDMSEGWTRPGLTEFLKAVAEMYEMHVYTMGTRAYASEVCKVIDPKGDLFRGRILSRDESGSESLRFPIFSFSKSE